MRGADGRRCAVQIPRFAFEKFPGATSTLTTQMKSVGEAMAMGRTFQESFQKALRSLETGLAGWSLPRNWKRKTRQQLEYNLRVPNPERMLVIKQARPPPGLFCSAPGSPPALSAAREMQQPMQSDQPWQTVAKYSQSSVQESS